MKYPLALALALALMKAAAAPNSSPSLGAAVKVLFREALAAHKRGDDATARRLFTQTAVAGGTSSSFNLGLLYEYGRGGPVDYGKAAYWYEKAARAGDAEAQLRLALLHLRGLGVVQDLPKARALLERAAGAGSVAAKSLLAADREDAGDYGRARQLYAEAAAAGDGLAKFNLGQLYERGQGGPVDYGEAVRLWQQAARADNPQLRAQAEQALRRYWLLHARLRRADK